MAASYDLPSAVLQWLALPAEERCACDQVAAGLGKRLSALGAGIAETLQREIANSPAFAAALADLNFGEVGAMPRRRRKAAISWRFFLGEPRRHS